MNEGEWNRLRLEAGDIGISTYVRARLFGGGVRSRDGLRRIAALHVIGRRVQMLTDQPAVDACELASTLADVRNAIAQLAVAIPVADAEDELAP